MTFHYKVKPGDTPQSIAKQHNITTDELLNANQGSYPFSLGQGIKVPQGPPPPQPKGGTAPLAGVVDWAKNAFNEYVLFGRKQSEIMNTYKSQNLNPIQAALTMASYNRYKAQGYTYDPQKGWQPPVIPHVATTSNPTYQSYSPPTSTPTDIKALLAQKSGEPVITLSDKALLTVYTPQQAAQEGWQYDPFRKTWTKENPAPAPKQWYQDYGVTQSAASTEGNRSGNNFRNVKGTLMQWSDKEGRFVTKASKE